MSFIKTLKLFETNVRNHFRKPCKNLDGLPGFISSKSFLSFKMTKWSLGRLRNLFTEFSYEINLLSMMNLSAEHLVCNTTCENTTDESITA